MTPAFARTEQRKAPARRASKQLEQTLVARAVNRGRPENHVLHAERACASPHFVFRLDLASLVRIPRQNRLRLVDHAGHALAVDAGGAAENEALHAVRVRRCEQIRGARDIHASEIVFSDAALTKGSSEMHDAVDAIKRVAQGLAVQHIARNQVDAQPFEVCVGGRLFRAISATQPDDTMTCGNRMLHEMAADEPARARDE